MLQPWRYDASQYHQARKYLVQDPAPKGTVAGKGSTLGRCEKIGVYRKVEVRRCEPAMTCRASTRWRQKTTELRERPGQLAREQHQEDCQNTATSEPR